MEKKNYYSMMNLIENFGEDKVMSSLIEKCLNLASSVHNLREINRKEDALLYNKAYNDVCEDIADMKLQIQMSEFLFNFNEIENHYENKLLDMEKVLP